VRRAPATIALWATFVGLLAAVLWLWTSDPLPRWLLTAASAASYLAAAGTYVYIRRTRSDRPRPARMPDASPSAALLGLGIALLVLGSALGLWLVWLGTGVVGVALIGLAVELAGGRAGEPERPMWSEPPRGRPPST
jgi:O-antigen/teichoic acid export membrane protein